MERHLYLATQPRIRSVDAVIEREEWPQVTISIMRAPPYAWSDDPIHWRFWSDLNNTSHISLRLNSIEACLDSIELIGTFRSHQRSQDHPVEAELELVTADPVFDLAASGLAHWAGDDRVVDAHASVELQIGAGSINIPVGRDPVAQWFGISRNLALGCDENSRLVALRFRALTLEQISWFQTLSDDSQTAS